MNLESTPTTAAHGQPTFNQVATIDQVKAVELQLTTARAQGKALGCISTSYLRILDQVIRHLRIKIARGVWDESDDAAAG